jgi:DNA adenine methylase
MKYMGSKAKIAKFIVPIIQSKINESGARYYLEPFAGGCNVMDKVKAEYRIASDKNEYLIALFRYLQAGGELPEHITRQEYSKVREDYNAGGGNFPMWYIGAVGFLASYNGRFFDGGYAGYGKGKVRTRDYYKESRNNILDQMQQGGIFGVDFACRDYREFTDLKRCVIYCDPPYENTKRYGNARQFDYIEFWQLMREWSHNNIVLVSELQAPDDFITIWEKEVDRSMKAKEHFRATEKLFIWGG